MAHSLLYDQVLCLVSILMACTLLGYAAGGAIAQGGRDSLLSAVALFIQNAAGM